MHGTQSAPIRDLTVAAPLKPKRRALGYQRVEIYPRPDGRGPIEARQPADYPRGQGRYGHTFSYPRPDGRGPIEATPPSNTLSRIPAIRDLTVAAPLKLGHGGLGRRHTCPIRDLTVAAPLKRSQTSLYGHPTASSIRDLTVAAPLKPSSFVPLAWTWRAIRDLTVAAPLKLHRADHRLH